MQQATSPGRRGYRSLVGSEFRLLSGDDATALAFLAQGGNGCISVTSNVAPGLCRAMYIACKQRAFEQGASVCGSDRANNRGPLPGSEPRSGQICAELVWIHVGKVRLPLVELTDRSRADLSAIMARLCDEYPDHMIGTINKVLPPSSDRGRLSAERSQCLRASMSGRKN